MNRRELVQAVAAQTGSESKQVDAVLRGLTDVITAVVAKGEPVAITGFAKFAKIERPARTGRNPATGETIKIKASKKARITPLKGFKDAVMTPSTAPKLQKGVWPPAAAGTKVAAAKKATPAAKAPAAAKTTATKTAATKAAPAAKATATRTAAAKTTAAKTTAAKTTAAKTTAAKTTAAKTAATKAAPAAKATPAKKTTTARKAPAAKKA